MDLDSKVKSVNLSDLRANRIALAHSYSLNELVDSILDSVVSIMRVSAGFVLLLDESGRGEIIGKRNIGRKTRGKIDIKDGMLESIINDKTTLVYADLKNDPFSDKEFRFPKNSPSKSAMYMPLVTRDRGIGLVGVHDFVPDAFGMRDLETLAIVATQAAMSLENYILYDNVQVQAAEIDQRLSELVTLYEAGKLIGTVLDLNPLMELIVDIAMGITGSDSCIIFLPGDNGQLSFKARTGVDEEKAHLLGEKLANPLITKIERTSVEESVSINGSKRLGKGVRLRDLGIKTCLLVPLVIREEFVGILNINQHHRDREFSANDQRFISTFSTQAAMAIKSALLYRGIQDHRQELEHSNAELDKRVSELQTLHEAGKAMGAILGLNPLSDIITDVAAGITGVDSSLVLLFDKDSGELSPLGAKGIDEATAKKVIKMAFKEFSEDFIENGDQLIVNPRGKGPKTVMFVPLRVKDETLGLLNLNQHSHKREFTSNDLRLISTFANQAALAIKSSFLYKEMENKNRLEQDLQAAYTIQQSLLPQSLPQVKGITFGGISQPAREVGGDFYDFIEVDSKHLGVVIGDVAGKSIPASLLLAMARSLIRAESRRHKSPKEVISRVNDLISRDVTSERFVTVLYLVLEKSSKKLKFSLGGHVPLLLYRKGSKTVESKDLDGIPTGLVEGSPYQEMDLTLEDGDVVVLYTDGAIEALNRDKEQFGIENLVAALKKYASGSGEEIAKGIYSEVESFTSGTEQFDDITIVTLKVDQE